MDIIEEIGKNKNIRGAYRGHFTNYDQSSIQRFLEQRGMLHVIGKKATFRYDSNFWTNKSSYVIVHGQSDYDGAKETKLPTYWTMPLQSLCLGMKTKLHSKPKWILLQNILRSSTLYSMIADDKYRKFAVGRSQWKSLLSGSSLQYGCNQEGFNSLTDSDKFAKVRIGIIANDNKHCTMTDSLIGFGAHGNDCNVTTGNCGWTNADNGDKKIAAYGIILGR
ncbi:uncharacterized protein LOC114574765 [Exaiptasia diaphana]|uniref:Uncharacterized protein n=1 Tax=Exaiptasia diaphana TaxID=2652724 RepID=A0A913YG31_EXADI|nr:uncharacterized protein LOC114574765 [Exaiptasia diaphana]